MGQEEDPKEGREIEIPLLEEDLQVQKVEKQRRSPPEEVHLTEDKTMTVPVRKEEIIIERTRATGGKSEAMPGEHVFEEDRIAILLGRGRRGEDLPAVRETVHVKKRSVWKTATSRHREGRGRGARDGGRNEREEVRNRKASVRQGTACGSYLPDRGTEQDHGRRPLEAASDQDRTWDSSTRGCCPFLQCPGCSALPAVSSQ